MLHPAARALRVLVSCATLALACGPESNTTTDADTSSGSTAATTAEPTTAEPTTAEPTTAEPTTGTTGATTGTTDAASSGTTLMPDPDHVRECQPGDYVCDDLNCGAPPLGFGECFKPCTPTVPGEVDDECDEPERPFCSQIGQFEGGDFFCNDCVHICVAFQANDCDQPADGCNIN